MNFKKLKYDETEKNPYIYTTISINEIKYKALTKNIDQLKKDFRFFIGKNKTIKRLKNRAPNYLNNQMNKIINRLNTNKGSNGNLIKSLNINIEGKNKRFMSPKEIEKFREKKNYLLKILSLKNERNETISNFYNKHSRNKRNISLRKYNMVRKISTALKKRRNINFNAEFKTSLNNHIENIPFFKSFIYHDSINKNMNRKKYVNQKLNNGIKISKHFRMLNPVKINNNNTMDLILNSFKIEDNSKSIHQEQKFKKKNDKKGSSNISLDFNIDINSVTSKDLDKIRRKIYLNRLRSKVGRFENSREYYPNDDNIHKNLIDPFIFVKKKNLSQFELNIFDKGENKSTLNKRMKLRKTNIPPKVNLSKTLTPTMNNKYKLTSKSKDKKEKSKLIIKKLNIIKKRANDKNINIKTMYNNNNKRNLNKIMNYFSFDEKKLINKSMGKEIKKDAIKYKNDLGNFIYIDGKFIFSSHLSHIKKGT